jgi:CubicO group peptidase (beta-lactamase class C family)
MPAAARDRQVAANYALTVSDHEVEALLDAAGYSDDGPGVAVAVRRPDGATMTAARGRAGPHRPFTPATVSYTAAVSKQIVGACVARAVLDGTLDTRVPLRRWLRYLPPWADEVKIRHLVHHTSGLPADAWLSQRIASWRACRWDGPAVLRALSTCPRLEFPPGSQFRYRNANYIALAALVERIVGDLTRFAERQLFAPLQMASTTLWRTAGALPTESAPGHPTDDEMGAWPLPLSVGDGGLWSTVEDLHRWNVAVLPGGALDDRLRSLLHVPGRLDDGRQIDYAWGVRVSRDDAGRLIHSHGGSWPGGWTATTIRLPAVGLAVAALSNSGDMTAMATLTDGLVARYAS